MARPQKIPKTLHSSIRELDLEGRTINQIIEWLAESHRISVGEEAVRRLLKRVRIVPPVDAPGLTDLIAVRSSLRADLLSTDWRQKHSAARLLVEIHTIITAERREAEARLAELDDAQSHTKTYTVDASPDTWPEPAGTDGTPETNPEPAGGAQ